MTSHDITIDVMADKIRDLRQQLADAEKKYYALEDKRSDREIMIKSVIAEFLKRKSITAEGIYNNAALVDFEAFLDLYITKSSFSNAAIELGWTVFELNADELYNKGVFKDYESEVFKVAEKYKAMAESRGDEYEYK